MIICKILFCSYQIYYKFIEPKGEYILCQERILEQSHYLGDDGEIDLSKFTPITYDPVHHGYYRLGERVGNAFKDGAKLK